MGTSKKDLKKEDSSIFVKIATPLEARRDILKSSLDATKILKNYKNLMVLRKRIGEKRRFFLNDMKVIEQDFNRLKKLLPKIKTPKVRDGKQVKKIMEKTDEESRLLEELADIEAKLKSMEI